MSTLQSKLKAVTPKAAPPTKAKTLIYGGPGVGKTWFSLDWPSVYFLDCEGGARLAHYQNRLLSAGGAYLGPPDSLSFDEVIGQVRALSVEEHPFKTLVIDSVSTLFSLEIAKEAERLGD